MKKFAVALTWVQKERTMTKLSTDIKAANKEEALGWALLKDNFRECWLLSHNVVVEQLEERQDPKPEISIDTKLKVIELTGYFDDDNKVGIQEYGKYQELAAEIKKEL